MLKFSYNHGQDLDFTSGMSQKDGFENLAHLTAEESCVPEELSTFITSLGNTEA